MWHYNIAGLAVASDLPLPGAHEGSGGSVDVTIRRVAVAGDIPAATARGVDWAMKDDTFLLQVPGVGRFLMSHGREIAYDIDGNGDTRDAAIFLLGSAFGILLHQRGHLVLHASAVKVGAGAALFCGPSGAGKSTLAAALVNEGYALVTDDVCLATFSATGQPQALPDGRMLKLWADAVDHLSLAERKRQPVRRGIQKFYVAARGHAAPSPLRVIYVLREAHAPLVPGIKEVNTADAAALLQLNAYRPVLVDRMGLTQPYFFAAARILGHAKVFYLTRRRDLADTTGVVGQLREHWRELELEP